jgi:glycosyltransferase involved in cell wall biosynthesis
LHVQKFYRPDFTGEGVFLERSSAVMQELAGDVEHEVLATETPEPTDPQMVAGCSTIARVSWLTRGRVPAWRREALLGWWFLRNLHRFGTVHFRTHADWYFLSYLMTRLAGRRLILSATLDDSLPVLIGHYRPRHRWLAALGFRLFHAYVGISPKLHEESRRVAAHPERCHLLPCGITIPPAAPGERARLREMLGLTPEDPLLLFVGGLCARKDPLFLIEAMRDIRAAHPRARLALVGPPLEPDYVRRLHEAAGTDGAVIFAGEQANPHPWFEAADLLVFASRMEGFGTVVPEAMAHGRPVVVRRLPGVNDSFVLEGETGFLFEDRAGFLAGVHRLLDDPALRARMGRAGAALAQREFGMRGIAARYLALYGMADRLALPPEGTPATGLAASASIPDTRFHRPAAAPAAMPLLVTMVDAEEAFDWSAPFSRRATDVSAMGQQHLAHRVFERHGVVPLYLADYPIAAQEAGAAPLRELLRDGAAELGAHMHPWVNPPFTEAVSAANSFAGNLPAEIELAKARALTERLAETFGETPRIYRTGRFGVGRRTADVLKRLGYLADSSVAPCWPPAIHLGEGAPWSVPDPHWVDPERRLMEIPVTAALVGRLAERHGSRLAPYLFHPRLERLRLPGIAARLGLLERIRLTPEGMAIEEAKRLTRALAARGQRVFVLTYHSPSLVPGNTPYVRSLEDRRRFLAWLDEYYAFFREEIGGRSASWREVRFGAAQGCRAPSLVAVP